MDTFYKVVTPDLTSFHDRTYQYRVGGTHRPLKSKGSPILEPNTTGTSRYTTTYSGTKWRTIKPYEVCTDLVLHASRTPSQAAHYGTWPYTVLEVVGRPVVKKYDKAGFRQLKVMQDLGPAPAFGPNGDAVIKLLNEGKRFSSEHFSSSWIPSEHVSYWVPNEHESRDVKEGKIKVWFVADRVSRSGAVAAARSAAWRIPVPQPVYKKLELAVMAAAVADLVGQHGLDQYYLDMLTDPWGIAVAATKRKKDEA